MNKEKKSSFGLSLNTWQEKNIESNLSLAWIKEKKFHLVSASIHDRKKYWIEPQPWMNWLIFQTHSLSLSLAKKYSGLRLDLNLYQEEKDLKNLSHIENSFFVSNIFKAEGRQKNWKSKKWQNFKEKVYFSASSYQKTNCPSLWRWRATICPSLNSWLLTNYRTASFFSDKLYTILFSDGASSTICQRFMKIVTNYIPP